jgi:hypothetical protein
MGSSAVGTKVCADSNTLFDMELNVSYNLVGFPRETNQNV